MSMLDALGVQDLRPRLNVLDRPLCRRPRVGPVTSLTLHYNGPALSAAGSPQKELRHIVEVDVPNHQQRIGADSLMYHLCVLSDGSIYQTRDYSFQAWHCAVYDGNEHSLSIHLPIGGVQDATDEQWAATTRLFDALIADYNLSGRKAVKAHKEWSETQCPGPMLMRRLIAWRKGQAAQEGGVYRIRQDIGFANVREGPSRNFPVALRGVAVMWPGDLFPADEIIEGEQIGDEVRWAHRVDDIGFVHLSLLEAAA